MTELVEEGNSYYQASQKLSAEYFEETGGVFPAWMFAIYALGAAAMMLWVAALVCGIIAARWEPRRRYAVASLVVCGVTPVVFCCGVI
jgi:MFS family permease